MGGGIRPKIEFNTSSSPPHPPPPSPLPPFPPSPSPHLLTFIGTGKQEKRTACQRWIFFLSLERYASVCLQSGFWAFIYAQFMSSAHGKISETSLFWQIPDDKPIWTPKVCQVLCSVYVQYPKGILLLFNEKFLRVTQYGGLKSDI